MIEPQDLEVAAAPPTARPAARAVRPASARHPPGSPLGHPLGPLICRVRHSKPVQVRVQAALVLAGCTVLLGLAAWLRPDGHGVGTHQQLGLPPCSLVQYSGIPCPTCGMTTAFACTVRGRWLAAVLAQPFGFATALVAILCVPLSLAVLISGKVWRINWYRISPNRVAVGVLVFFALAWGFKIIRHLALNG
ncbi:MAG: DUF2752 domain-containing protein [Planctomycetes bacterium]|nr:DUF2752 domain-containing protein [Planctomycetota bacterium]